MFEEQQEALVPFIEQERLMVHQMTPDDLSAIKEIQQSKPKLSEQDCSAFYQAQQNECTLLTSDNTLRRFAKEKSIEVHGHLWIFDALVVSQNLAPDTATLKLKELCQTVNPKLGLPKAECEKRYVAWSV